MDFDIWNFDPSTFFRDNWSICFDGALHEAAAAQTATSAASESKDIATLLSQDYALVLCAAQLMWQVGSPMRNAISPRDRNPAQKRKKKKKKKQIPRGCRHWQHTTACITCSNTRLFRRCLNKIG
eukprot:5401300-Amphidinium_carterae.1